MPPRRIPGVLNFRVRRHRCGGGRCRDDAVETSGAVRRILGVVASDPSPLYKTARGEAWLGDAIETLQTQCENESVDLIVTSPPFALSRPKEYGNESQDNYKA